MCVPPARPCRCDHPNVRRVVLYRVTVTGMTRESTSVDNAGLRPLQPDNKTVPAPEQNSSREAAAYPRNAALLRMPQVLPDAFQPIPAAVRISARCGVPPQSIHGWQYVFPVIRQGATADGAA